MPPLTRNSKVDRPNSVRVRHEGVSADDVCDAVWDFLGRPSQIFRCIQQLNRRTTDLTLALPDQALKVAEKGNLEVNGKLVTFQRAGTNIKRVFVKNLPGEVPVAWVNATMGKYGRVIRVDQERKKVSRWTEVTGTFIVTIDMNLEIPNFLHVGSYEAMIIYKGVRKICKRCGHVGHIQIDCHKFRCTNCYSFDHLIAACTEPCGMCSSSEHKRSDCTRKAWASVISQKDNEVEVDDLTMDTGEKAEEHDTSEDPSSLVNKDREIQSQVETTFPPSPVTVAETPVVSEVILEASSDEKSGAGAAVSTDAERTISDGEGYELVERKRKRKSNKGENISKARRDLENLQKVALEGISNVSLNKKGNLVVNHSESESTTQSVGAAEYLPLKRELEEFLKANQSSGTRNRSVSLERTRDRSPRPNADNQFAFPDEV